MPAQRHSRPLSGSLRGTLARHSMDCMECISVVDWVWMKLPSCFLMFLNVFDVCCNPLLLSFLICRGGKKIACHYERPTRIERILKSGSVLQKERTWFYLQTSHSNTANPAHCILNHIETYWIVLGCIPYS